MIDGLMWTEIIVLNGTGKFYIITDWWGGRKIKSNMDVIGFQYLLGDTAVLQTGLTEGRKTHFQSVQPREEIPRKSSMYTSFTSSWCL